MDCSRQGSPDHRILWTSTLEWAAISFPGGVFLTQELNLGLLHWQVDSLSVRHQSRHLLVCECVLRCFSVSDFLQLHGL